jgi:hypothetical protein
MLGVKVHGLQSQASKEKNEENEFRGTDSALELS